MGSGSALTRDRKDRRAGIISVRMSAIMLFRLSSARRSESVLASVSLPSATERFRAGRDQSIKRAPRIIRRSPSRFQFFQDFASLPPSRGSMPAMIRPQ